MPAHGEGLRGTILLTTDNCQAAYEQLKGRGVEFVELPEERPYGIDSSFRDPSGNNIRLTPKFGRSPPSEARPSRLVGCR